MTVTQRTPVTKHSPTLWTGLVLAPQKAGGVPVPQLHGGRGPGSGAAVSVSGEQAARQQPSPTVSCPPRPPLCLYSNSEKF